MNEHTIRGAQTRAVATRSPEDAVAADVQEGVRKALTTNTPNPFAMTFEGQGPDGRKFIAPYVRKAGRSVILNEVAKRKGGIALMRSICVRSANETKSDLLDILAALPPEMKREFIASRGGDYRCLSLPDGTALYKFMVLFRNGEKWEGEGIANPRNVRMVQLHNRLDEMAETRAFMRCVGRGTADGFIDPEQACGNDDLDAAEAELLAEEQALEQEAIDLDEEADPDEGAPFPDGDGESGPAPGQTDEGRTPDDDQPAESGTEGTPGTPADAGVCGDPAGVCPDSGDDESAPTVEELIALASRAGVLLVGIVQKRFGKKLRQLTAAERIALRDELTAQAAAQ